MQQQPTTIAELIRLLRHFGARPGLYIRPIDVQNAQSFLGGVNFCVQVLTGSFTREELDEVVLSRGWKITREGLEPQMRERGMGEAEMIRELAEIEAVALERRSEAAA